MNSNPAAVVEVKDHFLTLPNILTLTRLCLVPAFLIFSLRRQAFEAFLVFSLAGLTDFLDGLTARLFHLRTRIGMLLDPMADKVLMATAFLVLTFTKPASPSAIPLWLTAAVLGRDLLIVSGAWVISRTRGIKTFLPSLLGKISTVLQMMTVFSVLFYNFVQAKVWAQSLPLVDKVSPSLLGMLFLLTLLATLLSGVDYIFRGARIFFSSRAG